MNGYTMTEAVARARAQGRDDIVAWLTADRLAFDAATKAEAELPLSTGVGILVPGGPRYTIEVMAYGSRGAERMLDVSIERDRYSGGDAYAVYRSGRRRWLRLARVAGIEAL